jgi:hypothetical protein
MSENNLPKCFFAYPSKPQSFSEVIENAIQKINETKTVDATSWKKLSVTGKLVIHEICRAIDFNDIFVCELTNLNPNVLFELGYAIARNKRVWILLDPSIPFSESQYKQVKMLTSVGYAKYQNSYDIVTQFFTEKPFQSEGKTLFEEVIAPAILTVTRPPSLVYLKSAVNTEASAKLSRRIGNSLIPVVTDDPSEIPIQTLSWYAENIYNSMAVIIHLLDDRRAQLFPLQNAKYSFVSGLAWGSKKKILMIAHAPYEPAFDYQELCCVHESAAECIAKVEDWLEPIEREYNKKQHKIVEREREQEASLILQQIHLGDQLAENERIELLDYFIITAPYTEALHARQPMIYVGRKGTGKTANLIKIADELKRDKRNHVCTIMPVDYDLEGIISLLKKRMAIIDRGYLLQSLWKFLIYTQLANSALEVIQTKPSHIPIEDKEKKFIEYCETIKELIIPDFTLRLEKAINDLCHLDYHVESSVQRIKISEILHEQLLSKLREQLGLIFSEKQRVIVLVDNIDKAWRVRDDLPPLSEFLFGLLSVCKSISEEFGRSGSKWKPVNMPLIVFLRSDIYSYIISHAREADKISSIRMDWTDYRLLERIIEERFVNSLNGQIFPNEVWTKIFTPMVLGIPTKEYIMSKIILRPRDIIYYCKASLAQAINRGHSKIEQEDILRAEEEYSQYAYLSLITETKPQFPKIEEYLIEFAGSSEIVSYGQLIDFAKNVKIDESSISVLIELLAESLFLGLETGEEKFEYIYDQSKATVLTALSKKISEKTGKRQFKINTPFHRYLEIISSK